MVNNILVPINGFLPWEPVLEGHHILSPTEEFTLAQEYAYLDEIAITPAEDAATNAIAAYIGNGLNYLIRKHNGRLNRKDIAVRDVVQYDAVNPDLSRFPLVKCYRLTEEYLSSGERKVSAVIAYCLTFPEQDELPGVLSWVSAATNMMLKQYAIRHQSCPITVDLQEQYRAEYRILVNEVSNPVYAFLRFNFSFSENFA